MSSPNRPLKLDDLKKPDLSGQENPFAEEEIIDAKEADADAPADYRGAYEMIDNSGAWFILLIAIFGFCASALPAVNYLVWPNGVLLGVFGWLVSWIIALPALIYAQVDLKSIRLGQYSERGAWMSHSAFWIALLTMVNSIATVVILVLEVTR